MARISRATALLLARRQRQRQGIPPKPTCSPYECAIFNSTRRIWEIRPKSSHALKAAGLHTPKATPAPPTAGSAAANISSCTTTTTTTTTTAAAAAAASSEQATSSQRPTEPAAAATATNTTTPLSRLAKKAKPVLFRPVNHDDRINKPSARRRAEATASERQVARERAAKALEGVDERLLACRVAEESDSEKQRRERLGFELAKTCTKRDMCSKSAKGGRGYMFRR